MRAILAASLLVAFALAGCAGDADDAMTSATTSTTTSSSVDHSPTAHAVAMAGNAFSNATLLVMVGDTVTWTHNDGPTAAHTVTSTSSADPFDSSPSCAAAVPVPDVCLTQGETYSHTFGVEGTIEVHCKIHSAMTMNVVVAGHNATAASHQSLTQT